MTRKFILLSLLLLLFVSVASAKENPLKKIFDENLHELLFPEVEQREYKVIQSGSFSFSGNSGPESSIEPVDQTKEKKDPMYEVYEISIPVLNSLVEYLNVILLSVIFSFIILRKKMYVKNY